MGQYTFNHNDNSIMNLLNDMIWYDMIWDWTGKNKNQQKKNEWMNGKLLM